MSKKKGPAESCSPLFDEVKVPGGSVDWSGAKKLVKKYRYPVVVRISRTKSKGEYYKSVHAAKDTPCGAMVGLYLGAVVDTGAVSNGRWCIGVPGYRKIKALDSRISVDWPWERYLAKKAVGGFFNSSRKMPNSVAKNLKDANCKLEWFYKSYDASKINGGRVYAALFTRRHVRRGAEFLWDYNWLP